MDKVRKIHFLLWLAVLFMALTFSSCGQKMDIQQQMTGKWEGRLNHEAVDLKIDGNSKTVSFDGKIYPAAVDSVDEEKGEIHLKVQNGAAAPEEWVLTQMWEDSDRFNIVLERGEHKTVLIPRKG